MCGIAGYVRHRPGPSEPDLLDRLLGPIRARGPDGEGLCLVSGREGKATPLRTGRTPSSWGHLAHYREGSERTMHDIAMVHTRYAVIDLTEVAHQPFSSPDGKVVAAFQGEIFNYVELRNELRRVGHEFRTASDTEVLVHAVLEWGDGAWERFNGFWAAVVYDRRDRRLILSRDRLGIAPLHLARGREALFFGSSALGLAGMLEGGPRAEDDRVRQFIETGLRDFDHQTLLGGVTSVRPGTFLAFDATVSGCEPTEHTFWSPPTDRWSSDDLSLDEAASLVRDTLASAVEYRLRSDLPVAFQLSGGLDSTSVVALASSMRTGPLPAYTVSVPELDEEPLAGTVARRFGLDWTVLSQLGHEMMGDPAAAARLMGEPVQAPAAFANHAMCRRMKADGFGVTLSGSGGDESLGGYEWDFWPAAKRELKKHGRYLQAWMYQWELEFGSLQRARRSLGARLSRFGAQEPGPARGPGTARPPASTSTLAADLQRAYEASPYDERRRYHLRVAHLPYYLASNDRATLGVPIEHRQPFLDHRVVETGVRMPPEYLFRRGWTKYVLRRAMAPLLPKEVVWRREKYGFPYPLARLAAEARPQLEEALRDAAKHGFADADADFARELANDPRTLWRRCSVGMWTRVLDVETAV